MILASCSYGVSTLYGQHLVAQVRGLVLSTTSLIGAVIVLLSGLLRLPRRELEVPQTL